MLGVMYEETLNSELVPRTFGLESLVRCLKQFLIDLETAEQKEGAIDMITKDDRRAKMMNVRVQDGRDILSTCLRLTVNDRDFLVKFPRIA